MDKQIYYEITHDCGMMSLYSVVSTTFGGDAKNFIKSDPFVEPLRDFAESQGWKNINDKEVG